MSFFGIFGGPEGFWVDFLRAGQCVLTLFVLLRMRLSKVHHDYHGMNGPYFFKAPLGGKLVLLAILIFAFSTEIQLQMIDDRLGCAGAAAYAATISRCVASVVEQDSGAKGYVTMFVLLVLISITFLSELELLSRSRIDQWKPTVNLPTSMAFRGELLLLIGTCLVVLTAALEDGATNCDLVPSSQHTFTCVQAGVMSQLHLIGIGGGIVVSTIGELRLSSPTPSCMIAPLRSSYVSRTYLRRADAALLYPQDPSGDPPPERRPGVER